MREALSQTREDLSSWAYTLLRIVVGVIMVAHGRLKLQDLQGWVDHVRELGIGAPEVMGRLALAGELAGGFGLILGLLTPLAAFGVGCVMFMAIAKVHWGNGLMAQNNGFEYPLTLLLSALYFMFRGSGSLGVDALLAKHWRARKQHARGAKSEGGDQEGMAPTSPRAPRAPHVR